MRPILSLLLILSAQAFLSADAKAQITEPACPSVVIESKINNPRWAAIHDAACPGARVTFTAVISGIVSKENQGFRWTISAGKIISGQGTSTITVSTEEADGREVTATVEVVGVSGFKAECSRTASATIQVAICCLPPCPTLSINCPTYVPERDKPVTLSLNMSGGDPDLNLKYKWQVSAGKIISGQGTPEISVDPSGAECEGVTATVEVDGLPPECDKAVSCSFATMICDPPWARKFDEYGDISWINEEARLANLGIQLKEEPGATGYVIIYGPHRVSQHLERVRKFLVEKRGIDPKRIVMVNGGYRKKATVELWVVPIGADPPKPNSNF